MSEKQWKDFNLLVVHMSQNACNMEGISNVQILDAHSAACAQPTEPTPHQVNKLPTCTQTDTQYGPENPQKCSTSLCNVASFASTYQKHRCVAGVSFGCARGSVQ